MIDVAKARPISENSAADCAGDDSVLDKEVSLSIQEFDGIRDPDTGVGGIIHFMLSGDTIKKLDQWGGNDSLAPRFGIAATEKLIDDIWHQANADQQKNYEIILDRMEITSRPH